MPKKLDKDLNETYITPRKLSPFINVTKVGPEKRQQAREIMFGKRPWESRQAGDVELPNPRSAGPSQQIKDKLIGKKKKKNGILQGLKEE